MRKTGRGSGGKKESAPHVTGETMDKVVAYISGSAKWRLPADVAGKAKQHIMDTMAAMVSGSTLRPGRLAAEFIRTRLGAGEAQVVGTEMIASAIDAAMVNGMMAHSDETDDSHEKSLTHPGCSVVPAALAISEWADAGGRTFLNGVVVGYDICCRITQALGIEQLFYENSRSTHSIGGTFGAAAAGASILGLSEDKVRAALSYAAQQASGITSWQRDAEHVEKTFDFAGMPARNGVTAALFAHAGLTGVSDIFSGPHNFLDAFSPEPDPQQLVDGLGSRYEITETNIKRFSVGSPIQAPLDALLLIREKYRLRPEDVTRVVVRFPQDVGGGASIVDAREMPDVNLQYILAVALLDGTVTFEAAHSYKRMVDPSVVGLGKLVSIEIDPALDTQTTARQAAVYVTTAKGEVLKEHVLNVRGTAANPMTDDEVEKKCRDLFEPVLGRERTGALTEMIWNLEKVKSMRDFRRLLRA